MLKIKAWFSALRIRTLTLSLSGILLGSGAAHYNNHWNNKIFFLSILTSILFQIISNLANDLGDGIKGPKIKHKSSKKFDVGDNKLEYYLNKGVTFSNI